MTFAFPLGLLGLIGIPVIIIIYILQSKYTEQIVNSTYIWTLSERFLRRKNPLSGITGLISLILQILLVAAVSLAIARPTLTLPGTAYDYCFVLDASGSMTMEEEGETRFDMAKEEIVRQIKRSKNGSSYTLVSVSGETVTLFDGIFDKKSAIALVNEAEPTHTGTTHEALLSAAQSAYDASAAAKVYLVTDKDYEKHDNIEIISVGDETAPNYGVFDVEHSHINGVLTVTAGVVAYHADATVSLALSVDGVTVSTKEVDVKAGVKTPATLSFACEGFSEYTVSVLNGDGYSVDDSIIGYNTKSDKSYSVLIVSESGFFFRAVIDALVDCTIDVIDPDDYPTVTESYGLYIFDSFQPTTLPDGAVWLINADTSVENAGFGVRNKVEIAGGDVLTRSTSSSTQVRHLLRGLVGEDIHITNYVKYSAMYLSFHTLFSYDSNPIIFAGTNGLGNRQVVFGFDIHESDFALTADFVILARNLLEYSFPDVIDEVAYTVGDDVIVNVVKNATGLSAVSPSGRDIYIEPDGTTAAVSLTEVGTYTFSVTVAGKESTYKLFAGAHPTESTPTVSEPDFSLAEGVEREAGVGEYDLLPLLFILIAVLFMADWGVYLYEKYQLR